jgi:hypothetical protein
MNKRDLVLGAALSLAAAGASAQAQTSRAPKTGGAPEGAPGAPYIPSNYGQTMNIMFTTSTDLNAFMPPGLTAVDPHRAFIKAERIKLRSPKSEKRTAAFTQYEQICITTMATTPEFGPRHRNILMWEDRAWAVGSTLLAVKRWGKVDMTQIFDLDHKLVAQGTPVPFFVTVQQDGHTLMTFAGSLDGQKRAELPPYPGFYVGGDPGQDLTALTLDASDFSNPIHGTGTLSFGASPADRGAAGPGKGWPATLLKDIRVQGCVFQDFSFTRSYGTEMKTVRKALPGNGRSRL